MLKRIYIRLGNYVASPYADYILALLCYIEALFFFPVDPLLMLYCLENRSKSLYYATIATISSVAGGTTGYFIGYTLWESFGQRMVFMFFTPDQFSYAVNLLKSHEALAIFIGGFTPIPYKLFTLCAGFCKLSLTSFILFSLLSRGARFFLIAGIIQIWGDPIKEYIDRYFNFLVVLITGIVALTVWMLL